MNNGWQSHCMSQMTRLNKQDLRQCQCQV